MPASNCWLVIRVLNDSMTGISPLTSVPSVYSIKKGPLLERFSGIASCKLALVLELPRATISPLISTCEGSI